MAGSDAARLARLARNEAVFRDVNEAIYRVTRGIEYRNLAAEFAEFLCECSNAHCAELIKLSILEYDSVRQRGDRFVVVPRHEDAQIERIVERHERYTIVEKIGSVGVLARRLDRRG